MLLIRELGIRTHGRGSCASPVAVGGLAKCAGRPVPAWTPPPAAPAADVKAPIPAPVLAALTHTPMTRPGIIAHAKSPGARTSDIPTTPPAIIREAGPPDQAAIILIASEVALGVPDIHIVWRRIIDGDVAIIEQRIARGMLVMSAGRLVETAHGPVGDEARYQTPR